METTAEESTTPQFDVLLGGSEKLPNFLHTKGFISSRIQEIEALTSAIEDPEVKGMAFQHLPKHMRRRAMGHNSKRMPRRLREKHQEALEKSGIKVSKRPSRKFRRRPKNLLEEYNRRQRSFVWLETHIWHAKRFHMVEKWGYKIANYPNDKCFRACYRASANYCLIQDISYYICIELSGNVEQILKGLSLHTSPECGLTFGAKSTLDGTREGRVVFFKREKYPWCAIGEVKFLWNPEGSNDRNTLWIWVHSAYYEEVFEEILSTFALENVETVQMEAEEDKQEPSKKKRRVEEVKLETRNHPFTRTPKFSSKKHDVRLTLLKDVLNRFRLVGPNSQDILTKALRAVDSTSSDWVLEYTEGKEGRGDSIKHQKNLWDKVGATTSPSHLPPSCVMSLVVLDPRFTMPSKRSSTRENIEESSDQLMVDVCSRQTSRSPLWNWEVRDKVTDGKISWGTLSDIRALKVVPGLEMECPDTREAPCIPVLLIQQSGAHSAFKRTGYGSGWDIVLPAGWGMPVWMGLIFRGARPGGLREADCLRRESGELPLLAPDTKAGVLDQELTRKELTERHFRLPPAKRPSFLNLGITSPFKCPWEILLQEWSKESSSGLYVMRNKKKLQALQGGLDSLKNPATSNMELLLEMLTSEDRSSSLIPVSLVLKGKGKIDRFSIICCPQLVDIEKLKEDKGYPGPVENPHEDSNKETRKESRLNHLATLRRLKRKRVAERKKNQEEKSVENPGVGLIAEQKEKMEELWLPKCEEVKDVCSRTAIGFITDGAFTFTEACPSGQGYVCLEGFLSCLTALKATQLKEPLVLVRKSQCNQYRFAKIRIVS